MKKEKLTQEELKRLVHYDPLTGLFTRIVNNGGRGRVGDIAGCIHNGYIRISIGYKRLFAHKLAWLYMKGYFPEHQVDHKNGIRNDNRWVNLRHVTKICNMQNMKTYSTNTSGYQGVAKHGNKWRSGITINKKDVFLGLYDSPLEAALARFTVETWCPEWSCNCRNKLALSIKDFWPDFKF